MFFPESFGVTRQKQRDSRIAVVGTSVSLLIIKDVEGVHTESLKFINVQSQFNNSFYSQKIKIPGDKQLLLFANKNVDLLLREASLYLRYKLPSKHTEKSGTVELFSLRVAYLYHSFQSLYIPMMAFLICYAYTISVILVKHFFRHQYLGRYETSMFCILEGYADHLRGKDTDKMVFYYDIEVLKSWTLKLPYFLYLYCITHICAHRSQVSFWSRPSHCVGSY